MYNSALLVCSLLLAQFTNSLNDFRLFRVRSLKSVVKVYYFLIVYEKVMNKL